MSRREARKNLTTWPRATKFKLLLKRSFQMRWFSFFRWGGWYQCNKCNHSIGGKAIITSAVHFIFLLVVVVRCCMKRVYVASFSCCQYHGLPTGLDPLLRTRFLLSIVDGIKRTPSKLLTYIKSNDVHGIRNTNGLSTSIYYLLPLIANLLGRRKEAKKPHVQSRKDLVLESTTNAWSDVVGCISD